MRAARGAMGMRGGAVSHIRAISAGVKPETWLTRSLRVRSRVKVSAARARAGSMVRVYSSCITLSGVLFHPEQEAGRPQNRNAERLFEDQ